MKIKIKTHTHTQDVKLIKEHISEEIIQNFSAPHKLNLSPPHNDRNETGNNEKGEIIES